MQSNWKWSKEKISALLGTLGPSLLENLLTGKNTLRTSEGTVRVGQDF